MKTKPITQPESGMIAFNGNLMVKINRVTKDGFTFTVYNGKWTGRYYPGGILVHETKTTLNSEPFVEVLELTEDEQEQWYCSGPRRKG